MSSGEVHVIHPVTRARQRRAWSQERLASASGVPRTTLSAIESRRLTPSVAAALAIAAALETTVEVLFGEREPDLQLAWQPQLESTRYFEAEVQGWRFAYPVETAGRPFFPHDGVWCAGETLRSASKAAERTLVMACCDPAANLLAASLAREAGIRLLVLERGGLAALDLLKRGLIHVAGLHFSTEERPERNPEMASDHLGEGFSLLRSASWQEGIAVRAEDVRIASRSLFRRGAPWALRETGSAARDCLEEAFGPKVPQGRVVAGHEAVAVSVKAGWARSGVCVRLSAEEAGLGFRPLRTELLDLCFPSRLADDPRIAALVRTLRSREHRRVLADLPGYRADGVGEVVAFPTDS